MRPATPDSTSSNWCPAVLKGNLVPTATDVRIEIGNYVKTFRCVGLAEDGFVVESEQLLPLRQVLRCRLVMPEGDDFELFAFAATGAETAGHQELKPIGMSREMTDRWQSLRQTNDVSARARGTGPTRPVKAGVYVSLPRTRGDWLRRLVGLGR